MQKNNITDFERRVYAYTLQIPKGQVTSYKWLASAVSTNNKLAIRAVGKALGKNPYISIVPCHRVICSNGTIGGFQGSTDINSTNLQKKINFLDDEGVTFKNGKLEPTLHVYFSNFKPINEPITDEYLLEQINKHKN